MTSSELYQLTIDHLACQERFFVCRCGDGEAILLNGFNDKEKLQWLFKRQLGYMPELKEVEQIKQNLICAYKDADVIGMPENKRPNLNEYWYKCYELLEKELVVLPPTTTVDFHNEWLDHGKIHELLKGREVLYYVSCHELSEKLSEISGGDVYGLHISGEQTFFPGESKHYPDQFNKIKRWIQSIDMRGQLFIYGAGIVGKIYGMWAAQQGAVALDIGNVFDLLAGFKTRGQGRGQGVKYEKYKL